MTAVGVLVVIDVHWNVHGDWVRLLYGHWDVLLYVHGVRPVDGHLHWVRDGLLNSVRDVLVYWVRLGNGHFHGNGVGLLNMDGVRSVDWNVDGVGDGLLHGNGHGHWLLNGVRGRHVHRVRPVHGHLHGVSDVFDHWVRLGHGHFDFNGVWHVFLHGVGLGHGHLYGVGDVLLHGVRLGNKNLDGVRPVDGNVDRVRYFLLNWVRSGDVDWDFDVLLHVNWHVFDDLVRLGHGDLDWVWHMLLNSVWHRPVYGVSDRHSLHEGDGPGDIGVLSERDAVAVMGEGTLINEVVGTTMTVSVANITDVKAADTISVTEVQETAFVQLLVQRLSLFFCSLLLTGSRCCYQQEN